MKRKGLGAIVIGATASRRGGPRICAFSSAKGAQHVLAESMALRRARISNLALCIDDERNVGDGELPGGASVMRYRRRIDAAQVLGIVERR
jgi:hypothetical protein